MVDLSVRTAHLAYCGVLLVLAVGVALLILERKRFRSRWSCAGAWAIMAITGASAALLALRSTTITVAVQRDGAIAVERHIVVARQLRFQLAPGETELSGDDARGLRWLVNRSPSSLTISATDGDERHVTSLPPGTAAQVATAVLEELPTAVADRR